VARIRTIKPEFWTDEELSDLPEATHLLAAALLNYADDHGYFNANVGLVRAACSPLREPSVSIPESFRSLQTMGYLRFGTAPDGKRYGHIVKFDEHQRVSHPSPTKIPIESMLWDSEKGHSGKIPEPSDNPPENFRQEQGTGNREQGSGKELPPSAGAAVERPVDPDPIFGNGLAFLTRKGVPEKGARSFLGAMRKEVRDDLVVTELLIEAERQDVSDPLAWLRAAGRRRASQAAVIQLQQPVKRRTLRENYEASAAIKCEPRRAS
jgi:hypothetical protein